MPSAIKHIAILVEEQYQVLEVWYPLLRLREAGMRVSVIGSGTREIYPSKEGYPVKADASIEKAHAKEFDGLIIPGGWAPDFLRRYPKVVEFVKDMNAAGKAVASICHGGWLLVSADIVRGRKVTSFFAIKDDLAAAGGTYLDQDVVVDKNLITSRKPDDLPAFVSAFIKTVNAQ